jgi:hypothetical protein
MPHMGSAQLHYPAPRHIIGISDAELEDVDNEVSISWKRTLVLDEVLDSTFIDGKTEDHYMRMLPEWKGIPTIPPIVRGIERLRVHLIRRQPSSACS